MAQRTILLIAGEPSGDMLGAEVMASLTKKEPGIRCVGVGGPAMRKAGLESLGDISAFPGMGIMEIIPALPRLWRMMRRITAWARENQPDACLLIDNQDFSARIATRLTALGIPCFLYAAPKVWAWRPGRVHHLKKLYRHIFCLFPFEVDFFTSHGINASYAGHPVVTRMKKIKARTIDKETKTLALLPGSRTTELTYHWPVFLQTFQRLIKLEPNLVALVAVESAATLCKLKAIVWDDRLTYVVGDTRHSALASCTAALTKSGTNNLELALLGIPAVVAYCMHPITYAIAKRLVKVPFISPPNLVLGNPVYPEYIQQAATPENLTRALLPLLKEEPARKKQYDLLLTLKKKLTFTGKDSTITNIVSVILT